jgi:acyl carrier protein
MDFSKEKETTLFRIMRLIVINALEVEKALITFDSTFENDLGADSLDLYELVYQFETNLSVEISDDEAVRVFKTIGSLYTFLQRECTWIDDPKTAKDYAKRGNAFSSIYFALSSYETALEIDENCIDALIGRAGLFQKENQYENAIRDFSRILEISPNYPNILCLRGDCYLGSADTKQVLNNAGDSDPELGMGDFRYNIEDTFKKALEDFNNAIKADNKNSEAVVGRAKTYYRMGKYEESAKDYKKAVKISSILREAREVLDLIEKGFDIFNGIEKNK